MTRLIFLFLLLPITVYNQSDIDSIKLEPNAAHYKLMMGIDNPSLQQTDSLIALEKVYRNLSWDTCLLIGEKVIEAAEQNSNLSKYVKGLLILGTAHGMLGNIEKEQEFLKEAKEIVDKNENANLTAEVNNSLGFAAIKSADYENALKYLLDAVHTWETLENTHSVFRPYMNIGWIYFNLGELMKAREYLSKASEIAEASDNDSQRGFVYGNRAAIYMRTAYEFQEKINADTVDTKTFADSVRFFNVKAFEDFKTTFSLSKKVNDLGGELSALNNMVGLKIQMGEPKEAIELNKIAEKTADQLGVMQAIVQSKYNMAEAYGMSGQYQKASTYGKASLQLAKENGLVRLEALSNEVLYEIYKSSGQYDKALVHFEEYQKHVEEMADVEKNKALAEVEGKFQNVQKQKQILEQENEILELETEKSTAEKQRNFLIGGGLLAALLSFLVFRMNRMRKERNDKREFAEALIFAQEEERKRIARDLHDGIGQSLLLIEKRMVATQGTTLENQKMIKEALEEVRSISSDLHPFRLEKFGLTVAVEDMLLKVEKAAGLFITSEVDNIDKLLFEKSEINFFRTVQEALNNIVKHAEATAAKITIQKKTGEIFVKIQDNGKGFDHELAVVKSKSLGLRTMFERVAAIGGKLKIGQNEPTGTTIEFMIPIK